MAREIRSAADVNTVPAANESNTYKDRLVKLIPSEIVTAYITLQGLITAQGGNNIVLYMAISFGSLLILTPLYLRNISGVTKWIQIIFTTLAFIIWVNGIGGL